jgi:nitroimidazol reductase NimA-like FMN-containing flavoprotein (pyridoxamine 5'-phosphate oxidase superfamily)
MDLTALARSIIDANRYMTLATADEVGRPWASPVYFAHDGYSELLWVSSPHATHSRNIAARPGVAIVIFDSTQPIGTGQGVYMAAQAEQVVDPEGGMAVFSRRSLAHGGTEWGPERVQGSARLRLYRAVASQQFMLDPDREPDQRTPVAV